MTPEPKRFRKVEISEITQKIPQNAKFGMIIAVSLFWVAAIKTGFAELFNYLNIGLSAFYIEIVTAMIVTTVVWLIFVSWTKIARTIGKTKISIEVKPRNGNSKGNKR